VPEVRLEQDDCSSHRHPALSLFVLHTFAGHVL
jgi:hypothetical protein